jgi:hypothetical protein
LQLTVRAARALYAAWGEVERGPSEGEDQGQIFTVRDIGYYDTEKAALERGVAWAKGMARRELLNGGIQRSGACILNLKTTGLKP